MDGRADGYNRCLFMNQPISISEVPEGALRLGILMNFEGHIQESSTGSVYEKKDLILLHHSLLGGGFKHYFHLYLGK